jgi:phosphopantetheinyl transferase
VRWRGIARGCAILLAGVFALLAVLVTALRFGVPDLQSHRDWLLRQLLPAGATASVEHISWRVEETAEELRKMLVASLPYDEELSQLKSEARQLEYLAVRVLLRAVCGEEKHISHYSSGKPFLTDGSFHITISHTRGYVAVGLHATYEVGVDIEYISNRVRKVAGRYMYPDELRHSSDTAYLLVQWSAKETMYKLLDEQGVDFLEHLHIIHIPRNREKIEFD